MKFETLKEGFIMAKIMIVDDEAAIAMQLEEDIIAMGYEVVGAAASSEEAIDMAKRLNPDLILMDIVIKGNLDGIETAKKIRKEAEIPVIFITAYGKIN